MEGELDMNAIDPVFFRRVLGHYPSGITVVSGMHDGNPVGFTCQCFHSVSMQPPLISLCVMLSSKSWPKIRSSGRFCVNVLSRDQHHISDSFARSDTDKWLGVNWSPTHAGNPAIDDVLVWLDCELHDEHVAGDHLMVLGKVCEMGNVETADGRWPLIFFKGKYHQLGG